MPSRIHSRCCSTVWRSSTATPKKNIIYTTAFAGWIPCRRCPARCNDMARQEPEQIVTQSVLERLIDREPESPTDTPKSYAQSVRQLKASLRRDLEWLLNTRRNPEAADHRFPQLSRSVFNYGLPDITSLNHE